MLAENKISKLRSLRNPFSAQTAGSPIRMLLVHGPVVHKGQVTPLVAAAANRAQQDSALCS